MKAGEGLVFYVRVGAIMVLVSMDGGCRGGPAPNVTVRILCCGPVGQEPWVKGAEMRNLCKASVCAYGFQICIVGTKNYY